MNTEGKVYGAQLSKDAKAGAALFHCCARQQNKAGPAPANNLNCLFQQNDSRSTRHEAPFMPTRDFDFPTLQDDRANSQLFSIVSLSSRLSQPLRPPLGGSLGEPNHRDDNVKYNTYWMVVVEPNIQQYQPPDHHPKGGRAYEAIR